MILVVCFLLVCRSVCYKATTSIHMHTHMHTYCDKQNRIKDYSDCFYMISINMVRINTIIVQICHVCNGHSVNCVHFACREANNVNIDLALLVKGYVVRWLKYYCTFRMTHTCTVRYMYIRNIHVYNYIYIIHTKKLAQSPTL